MEPQHDRVIGFNERSERHPTDRRRTADSFSNRHDCLLRPRQCAGWHRYPIDRRRSAVHRRGTRCQARPFWADFFIGAGRGDRRCRVLRPAGGSLRPQDTADCRGAADRGFHDTDGVCPFRSHVDGHSRVGRVGTRRSDAMLHRVDLGIHTRTSARGLGHADVVGVSAWRVIGRAIELVSDPTRWLARDLLYRRCCTACSCRRVVFVPARVRSSSFSSSATT